ncbi:hypothetical protein EM308_03045 [Flavobacterium gilvum]|uniref:Outer membrane protein beta-barrel domain-containing protein n=1 Tax=Flavobacterium gilvum TaxID=1492737 RepID=A0AAC9I324_9FLAO|nr:hypothetical protein EM308_03045 [Flavobacterium gilvum]
MFGQRQPSFYEKSNNLELTIVPKMGFATFKESGNVPLNGFVNGGDVLLSFKMNRKFNLSTGLGFLEFDGNKTIEGNTTSLKNSYLHIPLHLKTDFVITKDDTQNRTTFLELGVGLYSNYLFKQEMVTVDNVFVDKNGNWNFGISGHLGIKFILAEDFNLGIGFETESDFTKINSNNKEMENQNMICSLLSLGIGL